MYSSTDFMICADEAHKAKVSRPDIMGHLIEHSTDDTSGKKLLDSESRLIIIAGRKV